jgi:hypothetical protein
MLLRKKPTVAFWQLDGSDAPFIQSIALWSLTGKNKRAGTVDQCKASKQSRNKRPTQKKRYKTRGAGTHGQKKGSLEFQLSSFDIAPANIAGSYVFLQTDPANAGRMQCLAQNPASAKFTPTAGNVGIQRKTRSVTF